MVFAVVYLHGFASSPNSVKGVFFRDYLAARGIPFVAPDLNLPHFRSLTLTRAIEDAQAAAGPFARVCVIGSSLGGYAAALWAARRQRQGHPLLAAMLIAPAFEAQKLWQDRLPPEALAAWKTSGALTLRSPGGGWLYGPEFSTLDYGLYEDALRWAQTPLRLSLPVLIFHGEKDDTVPVERSQRFADGRPNVTLHTFRGAGHGLVDESTFMADKTLAFFEQAAYSTPE